MENNKQNAIKRLGNAFIYSLSGLGHAFKNEIAFKQECCVFLCLLFVLIFLPVSSILKLILLMCNISVLVIELLNSGIEAIADRVSPEYHDLVRQAKDMGSAAVFLTILCAVVVWIYAFIQLL